MDSRAGLARGRAVGLSRPARLAQSGRGRIGSRGGTDMEQVNSLLLVGTSYRTAPPDLRGRLAGAKAMLAACCRTNEPEWRSISETVIVSTCNRFEVYAATHDPASARMA